MTRTLIIAGALRLAAAPAAAQNTAEPANTTIATNDVTANTMAVNEVGTTTTSTTNTETMAPPPETTPVDQGVVPAAPQKKSFPWGVIGLIGLLGLIPRFRRGR
jgi:hypothetical protein